MKSDKSHSHHIFPIQQFSSDCMFEPALVDERFVNENGIKFDEYAWAVERCGKALSERDSPKGRVMALAAAPTIEVILTLFGILRAGGLALILNPKLPAAAIDRSLRWTRATSLLGSEHCDHVAAKPLLGLGDRLDSPAEVLETHPFDWNRPATILMTSGSTGEPKFVVHSFANHHASAVAANRNIPLGPGDRWLLSLPLYHVAGIGVLVRCLIAGAAVAIPEPHEELGKAIERYKATHVSLVATQLYRLMQDPKSRLALTRLKAVLLGGSAFPPELIREAHALGIPVHTSYGMTETASQVACTPPAARAEELRSSGRPLTNGTMRIADGGEICVRGDALFLGYLDETGTIEKPLDADGWFHTRDLGHFDASGFLHVTGRKDNQFISGGENIQPEEIERALLTIKGVIEAIVVPVADAEWGHRPVAFVRTANGGAPDRIALHASLSKLLARFKLPVDYRAWPEDSEAGMKVSRKELANRLPPPGRTFP